MSSALESNQAERLLTQSLKDDTRGDALRELIEVLSASVKEIEEALDQPHTAEEQELLQRLAETMRTGDAVLLRLWSKFHKRPAVL